MKVQASAKMQRISPRKVRLVLDAVRGMSAAEAERTLMSMNKKGAQIVLKLLKSAVANADHNFDIDTTTLVISSLMANEGPTMKRYRPRAFGRATMIRKRTSHIHIELEGEPKKKAAKKKAAPKKAAEKKTEAKAEGTTKKKETAPKKKTTAKKSTKKTESKKEEKPAAEKKEAKADTK